MSKKVNRLKTKRESTPVVVYVWRTFIFLGGEKNLFTFTSTDLLKRKTRTDEENVCPL